MLCSSRRDISISADGPDSVLFKYRVENGNVSRLLNAFIALPAEYDFIQDLSKEKTFDLDLVHEDFFPYVEKIRPLYMQYCQMVRLRCFLMNSNVHSNELSQLNSLLKEFEQPDEVGVVLNCILDSGEKDIKEQVGFVKFPFF